MNLDLAAIAAQRSIGQSKRSFITNMTRSNQQRFLLNPTFSRFYRVIPVRLQRIFLKQDAAKAEEIAIETSNPSTVSIANEGGVRAQSEQPPAELILESRNSSPNLIRWLIILATVGLVGSFAIGMLLKRQQPASSQAVGCHQNLSRS